MPWLPSRVVDMTMSDLFYSNRSSVEPSSNASSPSSSSADPLKKKTRASKPKVRTGCITCKIRRVKCDEGKPACLRCTSTGRTCDGYGRAALSRHHSPARNQTVERARAEFVRACEWNETLRSMRRIEADIDGSETERRVFASFRAAIPDGAAARLCGFTSFWRRLSPSTGCQDEAIKHAVVALAVAYQQFHYPNQPIIHGFGPGDLEIFTIQQYNQSIESLQNHAGSSAAESIRVTLVCCLIFISLEMLRGNHAVAVTHITNGLRILQSLPDSAFDCLADGSMFVWPSNRDSLDMPDIIQLFARLELSACFFTYGIQPVISERGYRTRHFDDGSSDGPFTGMPQVRLAMSCFQHDAMARLHEIATITAAGDEPIAMFWCDPIQQQQQTCLLTRSTRLGTLIADFFSPARFGAPDPATPELFSLYLDLLYFHCAQFLISRTTSTNTTTNPNANPNPNRTLLPTILNLASRLAATPSTPTPPPPPAARPARTLTDMHTRLLGPLFLVATHAPPDDGTDTQAAAVRLLAECVCRYDYHYHGQPGIGDGEVRGPERAVRRAVGLVERGGLRVRQRERERGEGRERREREGWLSSEVPRALTGVGGVPVLWDVMRYG